MLYEVITLKILVPAKLKKNGGLENLKHRRAKYLQFKSKMELSNKKRTVKIKRVFNLSMVTLLLVTLFFVWKESNAGALIAGGILILSVIVMQFFQINYIYYSSEGGKILVRYYPIIAFFGKEYSSVEFDQSLLVITSYSIHYTKLYDNAVYHQVVGICAHLARISIQ